MPAISNITLPDGNTYGLKDADALRSASAAPAFSQSGSYSSGDVCSREGKVYRASQSHSGAWNPAHFSETSPLQEQIDAMRAVLSAIALIPDPKASVNSCQAAIKAILDAVRAL